MIGFAPIGNSIAIDFEGQQPTGGDISSSGREIVLRTYHNIYYWHRHPMTSVMETLRRRPIKIERIHDEPQGEAICWDANGDGFYTLSEGHNQPLIYFKRGRHISPRLRTTSTTTTSP